MPPAPISAPRVVLGIAGGSGSGKSWLAKAVAERFAGRSTVVCHDWYYKNHGGVHNEAERVKLNFDHPDALDTMLMRRQPDALIAGEAVAAPIYEYAEHSRPKET